MDQTSEGRRDTGDESPVDAFLAKHGPHLDDLWRRAFRVAAVFTLMFVTGFFAAGPVLAFILRTIVLQGVTLVTTTPFQFIDLSVDVGFFAAFCVVVPYGIWQLCAFVRPAVSPMEYRALLLTLPLSVLLFAVGFAYGIGIMVAGLQALADLTVSIGLSNYWDIGSFLSSAIVTATLLGALFQLPLILTFGLRVGALDTTMLIRYRRSVWAGIFMFVALLPPTDGLSLIVMSLPLILLYELTIISNGGQFRQLFTGERLHVQDVTRNIL
jgi:sec-independent protein translocase protein TatC